MMFALATVADVSGAGTAGVPAVHTDVVPPHAVTSSAALGFSATLRSALLDAVRRLDAQATRVEQRSRALGGAVRGWDAGAPENLPVVSLLPSSCG